MSTGIKTTIVIETAPELEFVWVPQGPRTKLGTISVRYDGKALRSFQVDATSDGRETLAVVQDACAYFINGWLAQKTLI